MSDGVKPCEKCHNLTEDIVCSICNSSGRDSQTICVVEDIRDLLAIENLGLYKGVYHVLGGVVSPMDGVGRQICSYKAWSIEFKTLAKKQR